MWIKGSCTPHTPEIPSNCRTVILIDGDNCISYALLGLDRMPEDVFVIAYFSQASACNRFRASAKFKKYHILAHYISPGNQAVDRAIIRDAQKYEANGNLVYFISFDKGFLEYASPMIKIRHSIDDIEW